MDYLRAVNSILQSNLTTFHKTELWISRTCLFLAIAVIAPTVLLLSCDLLLWIFRAGEVQERTGELVSKTREGVSTLVRKKSGPTRDEASATKGAGKQTPSGGSKQRRSSVSSVDSLMSSTSSAGVRELGKLTSTHTATSESEAQHGSRQRKDNARNKAA